MNLPLLYIDPGTGSALFSILIGAVATLYFLGRTFIIKLKLLVSGGKTSVYSGGGGNPFVIYNEGKQYCNLFKPVLDEFETNKINLLYLTSAEDDPFLNKTYNHVKAEYIGEENRAFSRLNMLNADIVLMTTPSLDVYQLKRSKGVKHYSHVLHMPSDAATYRLFGLDYFDSVLLTGDYQAKDIRILEQLRGLPSKQLVTVGCSYLDTAALKIKQIPVEENHPFTVLVSPSWGPSALLSRFGAELLEPLVKTGWRIIVRPHPQSRKSENDMLEKLTARFTNAKNLEWNFEHDNIYALVKSDIMISDFSGIIYDYTFLCDKPVMYVSQGFDPRPYDADDLGENAARELWQSRTLKEIGIELKEEQFNFIGEIIKSAADSTELKAARRAAKETAWMNRGEAGKRIFEFMTETENNLILKEKTESK